MKFFSFVLVTFFLINLNANAKDRHIPGFDCRSSVLNLGVATCTGTIKGYPKKGKEEPVVIYIPPTLDTSKKVEVIVHLHGHLFKRDVDGNGKKRMETFDDVVKQFKFGKKLVATGRNAILVLPSSKGRNLTYNKVFVAQGKFPKFMEEVETVLGKAELLGGRGLEHLVLTGHSGAYYSLCTIIEQKEYKKLIKEVYLFDAMYGCKDGFAKFAKKKDKKFKSAFWQKNRKTSYHSGKLWDILSKFKGTLKEDRSIHYSKKPIESDADVKKYDVLIVGSKKDHWSILNEYYIKFLKIK